MWGSLGGHLGVEFGSADPQLEANFGRCLADPWQILGRSVSTPGSGHCESDLGSVSSFGGRSTEIVVWLLTNVWANPSWRVDLGVISRNGREK